MDYISLIVLVAVIAAAVWVTRKLVFRRRAKKRGDCR